MIALQSGNSISNWFNNYVNNYVGSVDPCDSGLLPTAIRISARTIGMDLVTVQPMSAPTYKGYGYDFSYSKTIIRKTRKEKLEKLNNIFRKEKLKYIEEILKNN